MPRTTLVGMLGIALAVALRSGTDQRELDFGGKRNADGQRFAAFGRWCAAWMSCAVFKRAPPTDNA